MFKKTVDGVTEKLAKIVEDLREVAVEQYAEANAQKQKRAIADAAASAAAMEGDRATRIASKVKDLLS